MKSINDKSMIALFIGALCSGFLPFRMAEQDLSLNDDSEIDDLLEANLEEIEDLPDYVTPPAGYYKLMVNVDKKKKMKEKTAVQLKFTIVETIQLNNEAETRVKEGSIFTQAFFPDTSQEKANRWRWLKKAVKPYLEASGAPNLSACLDAMDGQVITGVVSLRWNDEKTMQYPQVDKLTPA